MSQDSYKDKNKIKKGSAYQTLPFSDIVKKNPKFSVENYKFNEYNTSSDGSGIKYSEGESIANISSNISLYAIRKEGNTLYLQNTSNKTRRFDIEDSNHRLQYQIGGEVQYPYDQYSETSSKNYIQRVVDMNIQDGTVSIVGEGSFEGCSSLKNIILDHCDFIESSAFISCTSIENLIFPKCQSIYDSAFGGCSSLTSIEMSNLEQFGTRCFGDCVNVQTIKVKGPHDKMINTSALSNWFGYIPSELNLKVVEFKNCLSIANQTFQSCTNLKEISLPECTYIGSSAFSGCTNISKIYLPNITSTSSIRHSAFTGCNFIQDATIGYSTLNGSFTTFGTVVNWNSEYLNRIFDSNCLTVSNAAFKNFKLLSDVEISNCIFIGSSAFQNCTSLSSIDIPNCVSISSNAFNGCTSLKESNFPKCTTLGQSAFKGCTSLSSLNLPMCTTIGNYAFQECTSLSSLNLPMCTTIGNYAFIGCTNLKTIDFPSISKIGAIFTYNSSSFPYIQTLDFTGLTAITPQFAFRSCYYLTSLYLRGSSVVNLTYSASNVFKSTPFDGYSAYSSAIPSIYVKSSLIQEYVSNTKWSILASYFTALSE